MKPLRISSFLMAVVLVGVVGCAARWAGAEPGGSKHPVVTDDEEHSIRLEDVMFKFDEQGNIIPVSASGKPFERCGEKGKKCKIFREGVTVLDIESIDITIIRHKRSPECVYVSSRRGRSGTQVGGVESEACL